MNHSSNRPETFKERRQEKLEAKSRELTVEEWRERKAENQEKFRNAQLEKLGTHPLKLQLNPELAINGEVQIAAWEGQYSSLLKLLSAAYEKSGETDPEIVNRKARAVQNWILQIIGDDYLAMTSAALLHFSGNTLKLVGVHSDKYGKTVEEVVKERELEALLRQEEEPNQEDAPSSELKASVTLSGSGTNLTTNGTLRPYNPADDGLVQRDDGTWVSDGSKPQLSGRDTRKPAKF